MNIEFRIVEDKELPPIVITMDEEDLPKLIMNVYHKVWISLNRRKIAGVIEALREKMDDVLASYLEEQYTFIKTDRMWDNDDE